MNSTLYSRLLITAIVLTCCLVVIASMVWVQRPQTGDLARIGGYPESGYGSRDSALRVGFEKPLFSQPQQTDSPYNEYHDVIVFGDSFSRTGGPYNWVSFFANLTGFDVIVMGIRDWQTVVGSEQFARFPPRLVIFQSVERDTIDYLTEIEWRLRSWKPDGPSISTDPVKTPGPRENKRVPFSPRGYDDFDESISLAVDVIWKSLKRRAGAENHAVVELIRDPATPAVFSSKQQENIVFLASDLITRDVTKGRFERSVLGHSKLRQRIERNEKTRFSYLVIPDRYSVLDKYLVSRDASDQPTLLTRLGQAAKSFDVLPYFQQALGAGVIDLYWPMDTHLSPRGAELLAEKYVNWLAEQQVISQPDR